MTVLARRSFLQQESGSAMARLEVSSDQTQSLLLMSLLLRGVPSQGPG